MFLGNEVSPWPNPKISRVLEILEEATRCCYELPYMYMLGNRQGLKYLHTYRNDLPPGLLCTYKCAIMVLLGEDMDIRDKMRKLRKYKELSARELSVEASMSVNTIQAIDSKRCNPTLKMVEKYLSALGYEIKVVKKES